MILVHALTCVGFSNVAFIHAANASSCRVRSKYYAQNIKQMLIQFMMPSNQCYGWVTRRGSSL